MELITIECKTRGFYESEKVLIDKIEYIGKKLNSFLLKRIYHKNIELDTYCFVFVNTERQKCKIRPYYTEICKYREYKLMGLVYEIPINASELLTLPEEEMVTQIGKCLVNALETKKAPIKIRNKVAIKQLIHDVGEYLVHVIGCKIDIEEPAKPNLEILVSFQAFHGNTLNKEKIIEKEFADYLGDRVYTKEMQLDEIRLDFINTELLKCRVRSWYTKTKDQWSAYEYNRRAIVYEIPLAESEFVALPEKQQSVVLAKSILKVLESVKAPVCIRKDFDAKRFVSDVRDFFVNVKKYKL